ncbi:MAG: hypothetical protein HZC47_10730 [Methanobacterium sp.]|uniref:hypothetical protein n=1 Tax=Methanobacterium sp. TaxID=2164 RepID=UPI003D64810B|nr:hypothetical protein [Methanobacterium sp.]
METRTRRIIVYICAAFLVVLGIYSMIYMKDYYQGLIWTVIGIFFIVLGYFKLKG